MVLVTILLIVFGLLGIVTIYLSVRNNSVFNKRSDVLAYIYALNMDDIENGNGRTNSIKRYEIFDSITYNEMIYKFWKSVHSFYKLEDFK